MPLRRICVGVLFLCISLSSVVVPAQVSHLVPPTFEAFVQENAEVAIAQKQIGPFFLLHFPEETEKINEIKIIRHLSTESFIVKTKLPFAQLRENYPLVLPVNDLWKLSPSLLERWERSNKTGKRDYLVKVDSFNTFKLKLQDWNALSNSVKATNTQTQSVLFHTDQKTIEKYILSSSLVYFIDQHLALPIEERSIEGLDLSLNNISTVHGLYPHLDGSQTRVSIKENSFDPQDIDLRGRELPSDLKDKLLATHATNMATLIGGAGNSFHNGKGVAINTVFSSSSFSNLLPDDDEYFQIDQILVQNHSYGLSIENYYGLEAMAYDEQTQRLPHLLHIFSAGNNGAGTSPAGPYMEISGFANLTGTMKMAKNILTVGALDSLARVPPSSSKGPAFDGRIKPELVAFGEDGSSGAAALTSGSILLLQQYYQSHYDELPSAHLLRAVLLNSADDLGVPGPDYTAGFGKLDLLGAIQTIEEKRYFIESLEDEQTKMFSINLPSQATDLKVTLAWSDPAASLNTDIALVNDLDIKMVGDQTGESYLPWILSTFPNVDSLSSAARRGEDHLNNQEQVTLSTTFDSSYTLIVTTKNSLVNRQAFSIAYEYKLPNQFTWLFPRSTDHVPTGKRKRLKWESTFQQPGQLSYKWLDRDTWITIAEDVPLNELQPLWSIPDTLAQIQLRMTIGEHEFLSDTITLSISPTLSLDLDCEDQSLLTWNPIPGAAGYQLYGMKTRILEPILSLTDTFAIIEKLEYPYQEYAVAAKLPNGKKATKSRSINLEFQSVGCYINNFLANLIEDRVEMQLTLGSLYEVTEIHFQKYEQGQFISLDQFPATSNLFYQTQDLSLRDGANIYRAVVFLQDGTSIISDEISLLYTSKDFLVFPNPTHRLDGISIITKVTEEIQFLLFDNLGRLVTRQDLLSPFEEVITELLTPGLYHYMILQNKKRRISGKILIH
ncbi:MAG: S8 family peptidase [Saprospiraceae bacterium]|nr:S8 family peptidase [Saprospiraceae bacterium]